MKTFVVLALSLAVVSCSFTSFVLRNQCDFAISVYRTGYDRPETDQCILPSGLGCAIAFNATHVEFRANKEGKAQTKFSLNENQSEVDYYEIDTSAGYDTPVAIYTTDGHSRNLTCNSATCSDAGQRQQLPHGGKFYVVYCP
ncbi:unnamed protein product [Bursaphelenchus okinawaensis]|uniref:Uncharacterized protein n=1 Tax=Bursaphelenchus okinawaensis TaxID=465554 RepID=A0A811KT42_9BILA|nr:unnamed protein product [Bursaphelenchus okinawaensis]CAG9112107.1 unnamed protein product [Bursaphelenchus okinawaensis]